MQIQKAKEGDLKTYTLTVHGIGKVPHLVIDGIGNYPDRGHLNQLKPPNYHADARIEFGNVS
jgi:hypothetical protein